MKVGNAATEDEYKAELEKFSLMTSKERASNLEARKKESSFLGAVSQGCDTLFGEISSNAAESKNNQLGKMRYLSIFKFIIEFIQLHNTDIKIRQDIGSKFSTNQLITDYALKKIEELFKYKCWNII